jgi:transcriptional regulator with XRE-family HTH domain
MPDGTALGAFLRWHRHRLSPRDVGLPDHGRRRVPGLRREEVAMLARISNEYYIRIEQGRERSPSVAVLDALAEALQLDAGQATHLLALARPRSRTAVARHTHAPESAVRLIDQLALPAVLLSRYMDVLAANDAAQELFPNMLPGTNRIRSSFLDPREWEFWRDWEQAAADSVAQLRTDLGGDVEASPVRSLIAELKQQSHVFRQLWSRQDVQQHALTPVRIRHPDAGDLELHREKLIVAGTDGIVLYIYYADAGSMSAKHLDALLHVVQLRAGP